MPAKKGADAPKRGRPSSFTQETADEICALIAEGQSLRSICLADEMPSMRAVLRWLADENNEDFRRQYARAREAQADALFDEILDIAEDGSNDWMERKNADGVVIGWQENGEALRRSALRVDARKWMAGKLAPKKYSDKQSVEHTGPDGGAIQISDERRAQALAAALSRLVAND